MSTRFYCTDWFSIFERNDRRFYNVDMKNRVRKTIFLTPYYFSIFPKASITAKAALSPESIAALSEPLTKVSPAKKI